jgi:putative glutamine amidotransferase
MMQKSKLPVVGLPACVHEIKDLPFHAVGDKYLRAVAVSAKALPVIIPSLGDIVDIEAIVASLDGLLMTGSPSNVHPSHYGTAPSPEAEPYDPKRDSTSLPLIRVALDQGLPLFAICRGFQELNVALGGNLHARVHEITGRMDHRRPIHPDFDVQYGPKHKVAFTQESEIAEILGTRELEVNSLHWQALDNVAEDLVVEGRAADQTAEAVRVKNAKSFAIGVQWHPEYKSTENAASTRLFEAFGAAVRARSAARQAS